jgi:hypothetical protein
VRATYRELVKVWHPDRFINDAALRAKAERRLQEINRAYAVLHGCAETVASPPEASRPPDVAAARLGAQWGPARSPRTPLVTIGLLTGAFVWGIVMMLLRQHRTVEPTEVTANPIPTVSPGEVSSKGAVSSKRASAPRPLSGTDLLATAPAGSGALTVLNADRRDAVLVFVDAGIQTRALYIRAGETLQMLDIAPGAYRIWVAGGADWSRDHSRSIKCFKSSRSDRSPFLLHLGS